MKFVELLGFSDSVLLVIVVIFICVRRLVVDLLKFGKVNLLFGVLWNFGVVILVF